MRILRRKVQVRGFYVLDCSGPAGSKTPCVGLMHALLTDEIRKSAITSIYESIQAMLQLEDPNA